MLRCPRCRSPDLFPVAGGYVGMVYRCKRCGYQGPLVIDYDEPEREGEEPQ